MRARPSPVPLAVLVQLASLALGAAAHAQSFVNFESGHVRPLALSPDGGRLFAVNTPDNRLAIYDVGGGGLTLAAEVPVGLEPVAVAARTNLAGRVEAWVVNHLSDSVSVVEVDPDDVTRSRVVRTLLVGDEPRDIVFAGSGGSRAFVTTARRGQSCPVPANLTTAGIGRALVWAFDADDPGAALGGTPLSITELFGDTPRALAASPDGGTVYAAVFHSGNQTTTILEPVVSANGGLPPVGLPGTPTPGAPETGLIVKFNPVLSRWEDEIGRNWSSFVPFSLPDLDVFAIDADRNPPGLAGGPNAVAGVGTVIFNMAVRPGTGRIFVGNTEARNHVRFEPAIQGNIAESRITVIDGTTPLPVHLNPHIDYGVVPGPPAEVEESLAFPMDMVFSADGATLFVVGFGSGKIGAFDADDLEAGIVTRDLVEVGGGPSGIVLDAARDRLYVMNRFDHTISVVGDASDPLARAETAVVPLRYDPSPPAARDGRRFLYDARATSAHGDAACASCHVFGDFDSLAWDLGDPFGAVEPNPNPFRLGFGSPIFHPAKGPMTTQSLRGMADAGPMHWRGDRTAASDPGGDPLDEDGAFKKFNPAFVGLLGRATPLTAAEMQAFTDFILTVRYPPNPIRALTNAGTAAQNAGQTFFTSTAVDGGQTCQFCHRLPLGTDGFSSFEGETQEFKIAHLRNMYQKVGMFGFPSGVPGIPGTGHLGPQVRGSGFLHDGSISTMFLFLKAPVFNFSNDTQRRNVEEFMLAFDTGLRPAVGQQVTLTSDALTDSQVNARIDLLIARDDAGDCDLVVKGVVGGQARGAVYVGGNAFQPDRNADPVLAKASLLGLAATPGQELVFTCVPPGSGVRIGVDRDEDGWFDRTELDAGSDPANPASVPGATTTSTSTSSTTSSSAPSTTTTSSSSTSTSATSSSTSTSTTPTTSTTTSTLAAPVRVQTTVLSMKDRSLPPANPAARRFVFRSATGSDAMAHRVVAPAPGSAGDPSGAGGVLTVYNSAGASDAVTVPLPAALWSRLGTRGFRFRDTSAGAPVSKVTVKDDLIWVRGGKGSFGYTLDEASQGSVAVRLQTGTLAWCAEAGRAPWPARIDVTDRFLAQRRTPAPAVCPPAP